MNNLFYARRGHFSLSLFQIKPILFQLSFLSRLLASIHNRNRLKNHKEATSNIFWNSGWLISSCRKVIICMVSGLLEIQVGFSGLFSLLSSDSMLFRVFSIILNKAISLGIFYYYLHGFLYLTLD